jgi:hypothetical protein
MASRPVLEELKELNKSLIRLFTSYGGLRMEITQNGHHVGIVRP